MSNSGNTPTPSQHTYSYVSPIPPIFETLNQTNDINSSLPLPLLSTPYISTTSLSNYSPSSRNGVSYSVGPAPPSLHTSTSPSLFPLSPTYVSIFPSTPISGSSHQSNVNIKPISDNIPSFFSNSSPQTTPTSKSRKTSSPVKSPPSTPEKISSKGKESPSRSTRTTKSSSVHPEVVPKKYSPKKRQNIKHKTKEENVKKIKTKENSPSRIQNSPKNNEEGKKKKNPEWVDDF
jgi:hypothetical protein